LLREGKHKQADEQFYKSIDVSPSMAAKVINVRDIFHLENYLRDLTQMLKQNRVKYLVAPYEADAQLVYLEKHGHIQAIISEDSDLLVFGAQRLLTKMDHGGNYLEIRRDKFHLCKDMSLGDFTDEDLRTMAILSGCDYSPGLPNIGLVKAYVFVRRYRSFERVRLSVVIN
jgi:exonuclease-1